MPDTARPITPEDVDPLKRMLSARNERRSLERRLIGLAQKRDEAAKREREAVAELEAQVEEMRNA